MNNTFYAIMGIGILMLFGMSVAQGYLDPDRYIQVPKLHQNVLKLNQLETLLDYCYQHASDSDNPVQDLVDKGLAPQEYNSWNCGQVKTTYESLDVETARLLAGNADKILPP
jgi:hypothetical protein